MRTPPGVRALLSPKTAFLLRVMWASSHTLSSLFPAHQNKKDEARVRFERVEGAKYQHTSLTLYFSS